MTTRAELVHELEITDYMIAGYRGSADQCRRDGFDPMGTRLDATAGEYEARATALRALIAQQGEG